MRFSFVLLAIALTTGCTAASGNDEANSSSSSEEALTNDRTGNDVTVLQGWIGDWVGQTWEGGYQSGSLQMDLARCSGTDCTSAADAVLESLLIGGFSFEKNRSNQCETLEIRTVTRMAAWSAPTFRGIGFHLSSRGGPLLVTKEALLAFGDSGKVTLKDGSQGIVHRFVAQGTCSGLGGNGGSMYRRNYLMKPFAQFDVPETDTQYRVWDAVPTDYLLGRNGTTWVQSFDRQGELLAQ